jgi:hypothetical protein
MIELNRLFKASSPPELYEKIKNGEIELPKNLDEELGQVLNK